MVVLGSRALARLGSLSPWRYLSDVPSSLPMHRISCFSSYSTELLAAAFQHCEHQTATMAVMTSDEQNKAPFRSVVTLWS